jgi:RND family efflux transporter MFP subunit
MERLTRTAAARRLRAVSVLAALLVSASVSARAEPATPRYVTVQERSVPQTLPAYGQVEPVATVRLRAVEAGTLSGLHMVPGSAVRAGEVVARIAGPRMRVLLIAREQQAQAAQAREAAAAKALATELRQFDAQLATRQAVDVARAALAAAHAAARTADAALQEARSLRTVRAPVAGTILAVQAANGEQIGAGEAIATLQPAGRLWLRAQIYGTDAARLHVGMTGQFTPSGDGAAANVKVVAIAPALAADGGVRIGLLPTTAQPWWVNGQWGSLLLDGPARRVVRVPTQALILDRGHWWVLVHTTAGDQPRQVVPGPAQGWWTAIASGLSAGQQVVVTDAFLDYHRGIAAHYTPPD